MNKKIVSVLIAVVLLLGGLFAYKSLSPKGKEGAKEVTINIIVESKGINYSEKFNTDELYLEGLLNAEKDELKLVTQDTQYGPMVIGMMDYETDINKEFFSISINGVDAMVGIKEIPVTDKDVYTFEVKGF